MKRFFTVCANLVMYWVVFIFIFGLINEFTHDYLENNNYRTQFIIHSPGLFLQVATTFMPIAVLLLCTWNAIARTSHWSYARFAVILVLCAEWAYLGAALPKRIYDNMIDSQFRPGTPIYFYNLQPGDYMGSVVLSVVGVAIVLRVAFGYQRRLLKRANDADTKTILAPNE